MVFRFNEFFADEDGNATIDWVVLTAGIVMLGLAVGLTVSRPAGDLADEIGTTMDAISPGQN